MIRQEALDWLNYRIELDRQMGRNSHFTMTDMEFFTNFIKQKTSTTVNINQLVNSVRFYSDNCMSWTERLINHLVDFYSIEVITGEKLNSATCVFLGLNRDSFKIINYR